MHIDRSFSERSSSSIFIVCVTVPLNTAAPVTTWEKEHEHNPVFDNVARIFFSVVDKQWPSKLRTAAFGH
jgi:hypothetical protein